MRISAKNLADFSLKSPTFYMAVLTRRFRVNPLNTNMIYTMWGDELPQMLKPHILFVGQRRETLVQQAPKQLFQARLNRV
jgi:hypothetical protein